MCVSEQKLNVVKWFGMCFCRLRLRHPLRCAELAFIEKTHAKPTGEILVFFEIERDDYYYWEENKINFDSLRGCQFDFIVQCLQNGREYR